MKNKLLGVGYRMLKRLMILIENSKIQNSSQSWNFTGRCAEDYNPVYRLSRMTLCTEFDRAQPEERKTHAPLTHKNLNLGP